MSAFCVSFIVILVSLGPQSDGADVSGLMDAAAAGAGIHDSGEDPVLARETLPLSEAMAAKGDLSGPWGRIEHREPSAKPARVRPLLSAHRPTTPASGLDDVPASEGTTLQLLGVRLQI